MTPHKPKALFIGGAWHQTKQMHLVAQQLPELDCYFSPYYADGLLEWLRRIGACDMSILGWGPRRRGLRYLRQHGLRLDYEGRRFGPEYELVVSCSDVYVPRNVRGKPLVCVQEGMTDPEAFWFWVRKIFPLMPRWTAGTAWTGNSNLYDKFCVASEGYRDFFIKRKGADPAKVVATGTPVLDDCAQYRKNDFPHHGFVLVCTSDSRETLKFDNRRKFIARAVEIARGRQLIFKLHPNENVERSTSEIQRWAPGALVFSKGVAEEMVANSDVLICQYSTLAFVGLALGKEVHSFYDMDELRRMVPLQGGVAARNIAEICRALLAERRGARAADASSMRRPPRAEIA